MRESPRPPKPWASPHRPSSPRRRGTRIFNTSTCKVWISAFAGMTARKLVDGLAADQGIGLDGLRRTRG
ncbi:hypothetical protein [Azospirillum endophyticum]